MFQTNIFIVYVSNGYVVKQEGGKTDQVPNIEVKRKKKGQSNIKVYLPQRGHTVPTETPQSMFEDPSSGSKTTQYLQCREEFQIKDVGNFPITQKLHRYLIKTKYISRNLPRFDGSTNIASSFSSDARMHWQEKAGKMLYCYSNNTHGVSFVATSSVKRVE